MHKKSYILNLSLHSHIVYHSLTHQFNELSFYLDFLKDFIYLLERERECEQRGRAEEEGEADAH